MEVLGLTGDSRKSAGAQNWMNARCNALQTLSLRTQSERTAVKDFMPGRSTVSAFVQLPVCAGGFAI
jgi:hypothetical protein